MTSATLRPATPADASALADLVVIASEGLCLGPWAAMAAPGETPVEVGRKRAARDEGAFSWRHATVAEIEGRVAAALLGYPLPETPEPIGPDLPPEFVPLQQLENEARGTWYVNVLATVPEHRGRGLGTRLLAPGRPPRPRHRRDGPEPHRGLRQPRRAPSLPPAGLRARAARPAADAAHRGSDWLLLARAA
jgi:GNAT superfamily N-acetyltransferase